MKHLMLDIETLGTRPGTVVLEIGVCEVRDDHVPLKHRITMPALVQIAAGCTYDISTLHWWSAQSEEAQAVLGRSLACVRAGEDAWNRFHETTSDATTVWAYSPQFDFVLIREAFSRLLGRPVSLPWSYKQERDLRTLLAAKGRSLSEFKHLWPGAAHDCVADAVGQMAVVMEIGGLG